MSAHPICQHHCCKWPNTAHKHFVDPEECYVCSLILHNLALEKGKLEEAEEKQAEAAKTGVYECRDD